MEQLHTIIDCVKPGLDSLFKNPFKCSLLFIFLALFSHRLINAITAQKTNRLPYPPTLPIIGNLHQLSMLLHRSLSDLSERYGPLMLFHYGSAPVIIVSSAEMVEVIKKDHDISFANRPFPSSSQLLLHGQTGVSSSPSGDYWREVRKICVMDLLSQRRVQSFKFIREEEVALLIEDISSLCPSGIPVNLSQMLIDVSYNIVSRCVTSRKPQGDDEHKKFAEMLLECMSLLQGTVGDLFPWLAWMDKLTGLSDKIKSVSMKIDSYLDQIIDEHLDQSKGDKDFVDILLQFHQNVSKPINLTRNNIKANLQDMYLGGTDTTSATMQWAMAELLNHPNLMEKAREHVRSVVGKKFKIDEEDIHHMDYLKCIVKETLRLHPPGPFLVSESFSDTVLNGYHIPARTRVVVNVWKVQRDVKKWDRPDEFIPERFIDNPIDFRGRHYEFIPFGAGRRGCPGISFGTTVVEFVLANLIYWFDWELPAGVNVVDMNETLGGALHMKTPLRLVPKQGRL